MRIAVRAVTASLTLSSSIASAAARSFSSSATASRRRRFNSLTGNKHFAGQKIFQFAELERRAAEPAKLLAQFFLRERNFLRLRQRHGGFDFRDVARFIARNERERFAGEAMDFDFDRTLKFGRCRPRNSGADACRVRIVRFPQFVADVDAGEINVAVAETQFGQLLPGILTRGSSIS